MAIRDDLDYERGKELPFGYTLNLEQFTVKDTEKYWFTLFNPFRFAITDVVLSTSEDDADIIDSSLYTLLKDKYYTINEEFEGGSDKIVYCQIIVHDDSLLNTDIYIKGTSFGAYTSNNALLSSGGGGGTYNPEFPYDANDVIWYPGTRLWYESKVNENLGVPPTTGGSDDPNWTIVWSDISYNPILPYSIGQMVWYPDNSLWYTSKTNNNRGNAPTTGDSLDPNWQVEGGLSSVVQDFDFMINSVYEKSGAVKTGEIALTDVRQLVAPSAYHKLFADIGTTYGGDGIATFGIPAIQDRAPKEWVEKWSGDSSVAIPNIWGTGSFRLLMIKNGDSNNAIDINITVYDTPPATSVEGASGRDATYALRPTYSYTNSEFNTYSNGVGLTDRILKIEKFERPSVNKPNMTYVIYAGNGSLSQVQDTNLDNRVTDLENKLAVVKAPLDTGWVDLGLQFANLIWNPDITLYEGTTLADYSVSVFYKSPFDREFDLTTSSVQNDLTPASDIGFQLSAGSTGILAFITGVAGMYIIGTANIVTTINNSDEGYLRLILTPKASIPLIQSDFVPVKDYVEDKNFVPSGSQTVTYPVKDGEYIVVVRLIGGTSIRTSIIEIDSTADLCGTTWSTSYNLDYVPSTGLWDSGNVGWELLTIKRKQDAIGQNRSNKAITDGYETVWEDYDNTTDTKTLKVDKGKYRCVLVSGTGNSDMSFDLDIDPARNALTAYGSWSTGKQGFYTYATGVWSAGDSTYDLKGIYKDTGYVNLNVSQINRTIIGVPNTYLFKKDTSAGDITMTATDDWIPEHVTTKPFTYPSANAPILANGDIVKFVNSGLRSANGGKGFGIYGLPQMDYIDETNKGHRLGASCKVTYLQDGDNHVLSFDDLGTVIDQYASGDSHVVKLTNGEMHMRGTDDIVFSASASGGMYISFPEPFISLDYTVIANGIYAGANPYMQFSQDNKVLGSISILYFTYNAGVNTSTVSAPWSAEGEWKALQTIS